MAVSAHAVAIKSGKDVLHFFDFLDNRDARYPHVHIFGGIALSQRRHRVKQCLRNLAASRMSVPMLEYFAKCKF